MSYFPHSYRVHGLDVSLNLALPGWYESEISAPPGATWTMNLSEDDAFAEPRFGSVALPAGYVRVGWRRDGDRLELVTRAGTGGRDIARFAVDPTHRHVEGGWRNRNDARLNRAMYGHLLHALVLPAAAMAAGDVVVVHAAVVAADGRALLVCGDSGAGKSTFAAVAATTGAEVLVDEPALVRADCGDRRVHAGTATLRVDDVTAAALGHGAGTLAPALPDGRGTKRWLPLPPAARATAAAVARGYPVVAVCLLGRRGRAAPFAVEQLDGATAVRQLLRHRRLGPIPDRQDLPRDLKRITSMVASTPVFLLHMGEGFERLFTDVPSAIDAVLDTVAAARSDAGGVHARRVG
jgi:hypothetical protein